MFMSRGGGAFPDVSGDGKITQKDILMARGVIPQNKNMGGMIRKDERTIRNVDDEIYRIAPKTYGRGRERMDAREEYARDLREKDYLRAQMNRLANGGPPLPVPMNPAMMAPPMMAPEEQVQITEDAAALQGEQLGEQYLNEMMTGLDTAGSTEEVIDAIRGNDKTLQERYDELANFVGEADSSATPESVLALVQPTIMLTEQGAMDSGIGELMQGIAGEVEMETEMGAPTPMGQGVGELMVSQSVEEMVPQMNAGGPVQHFSKGLGVFSDPSMANIQNKAGMYEQLYGPVFGFNEADEDIAKSQVALEIANRGLALASGVDPNTGQKMSGSLVSQVAQSAQGLPQALGVIGAQKRASERQIAQAGLGQAITEQTAMDQARYAQSLRQAGQAPKFYTVTTGTGETLNLDLGGSNLSDLTTFKNLSAEGGDGVSTMNAVSSVTQPPQSMYKNIILPDGRNLGTIDVSVGQDPEAAINTLLEANDIPLNTAYNLQNLDTTGENVPPDELIIRESLAKQMIKNSEAGESSRDLNRQLDVAYNIIDDGTFKQGFGADFRKTLGEINQLFGSVVSEELIDGVDSAAAFDAVSTQLLADTISELKGVRGTQFIFQTLEKSGPSLKNSPEGNKLIIDIRRAANNYINDKSKIADKYITDVQGSTTRTVDGKTYSQAIREFENNNEAIPESLKERLSSLVTEGQDIDILGKLENAEKEFKDLKDKGQETYDSLQDYIKSLDVFTQMQIKTAQKIREARFSSSQEILDGSTLIDTRSNVDG